MSAIIQLFGEVAKLIYVILPFTFIFSLLRATKAILAGPKGEMRGFHEKTERDSEMEKEPFPEDIKYGFFAAISLLLLLAPFAEYCYFY